MYMYVNFFIHRLFIERQYSKERSYFLYFRPTKVHAIAPTSREVQVQAGPSMADSRPNTPPMTPVGD